MNVFTHSNSHIHCHPTALKRDGKRVLSFQQWFLAPCLPSPSCLLLFAAIWDKQADLTGPVLPVDAKSFLFPSSTPLPSVPFSKCCCSLAKKRESDRRIHINGANVTCSTTVFSCQQCHVMDSMVTVLLEQGPASWSRRNVQGPSRPQAGSRCTAWRSGKIASCQDKDDILGVDYPSNIHEITMLE